MTYTNYQTPLLLEYLTFILELLDLVATLGVVQQMFISCFCPDFSPCDLVRLLSAFFVFLFLWGQFLLCSSKSFIKTGSQKKKKRTTFISKQRANGLCFQWHIKKSTWGILMLYRNADMQRIINVNRTFHK